MASTSAAARIKSASTTLLSDQSLIADIRKAMVMIKEVGIDSEKRNQPHLVKELEDAYLQLLVASEDCTHLSSAIQSVGSNYQPREQLTDFNKLFDDEVAKFQGSSSSAPLNHPQLRQFREAIWNVHHRGQPMPGDEQEDIVMTSTQSSLLNSRCPMTGKLVTALTYPVRSMDCKHIYEQSAIMHYIRTHASAKCPSAGCPRVLVAERVLQDPLLLMEIEESRSSNTQTARMEIIEDVTGLDEDD